MLVRLESVSFRYDRRAPWVLRDTTLSLAPGHITEVTGHNGSGKSTLLRLIAGLLPPRRGTITGRPGNVGYAPERFPTDQPFTVRAYLAHTAAMRKVSRTRITTWSERLAFSHLLDTRLPDLSKGTAQKVGLAQALLPSPDLLVLDEPFAGLDTTTRADLLALLTELAEQGTTVVASDHQSCLTPIADLARIHISNNAATQHPPTNPTPAPSAEPTLRKRTDDRSARTETTSEHPEHATPGTRPSQDPEWTAIEVIVRSDERDKVIGILRADGFNVREPGTPEDFSGPEPPEPQE